VRCADNGKSLEKCLGGEFFGCAHVDEVGLTPVIDDGVLGFEIAVDDAVGVKALN
jgi:hypothetical protein